jgi:polyisoprenyl-phosphate glycosyltransferase
MNAAGSLPRPALSVVVPCFNEEACLPAFLDRMTQACRDGAGGSYEIILVNDGSTDASWAFIRAMALTRPGVVGINLSRNHGHQLAVSAGLRQAKGERVLVIDADLQDPPELLVEMMARMDDGFDVVYGRRRARAGESRFKRATAHLFYRVLGRMSDVPMQVDAGDFRLMSRRIIEQLNSMPEQDRFLRGMIAWLGGRQSQILYDRESRHAGRSGYTIAKMTKLAVAGLTSFSTVPLQLAAVLTSIGVLVGGAVALYVFVSCLLGHAVPGWTSLALIIVFFSTAQLACLAVLSIYVGRIFIQVKQRPLFLVDSIATNEARVALAPPTAHHPIMKDRNSAIG